MGFCSTVLGQEVLPLLSEAAVVQDNAGTTLKLKFHPVVPVESNAKMLIGDSANGQPRYYIDISPMKLAKKFKTPSVSKNPYVKGIRFAQNEKGKVRIVFDLVSNDAVNHFRVERYADGLAITRFASSPVNIVKEDVPSIPVGMTKSELEKAAKESKEDLSESKPSGVAQAEKEEKEPTVKTSEEMRDAVNALVLLPPKPKVEETVSPKSEIILPVPPTSEQPLNEVPKSVAIDSKIRKIRIILDPGHGGDDPGAHGKKGTLEKDVTLDIALKTRASLLKTGRYEVFMTREKDATLQLLDRTKFANKMNGDLFISIHANASPKRTSKGVSTYFLNNADDQESLRVAMRENGELDPVALGQPNKNADDYYLEVMKASMVKNFHTTQSTDLARAVQLDMLKSLRKGYSDVVDLGVRSARFYVLTGATMPAILVETSFISNPEEEKRLSNSKYQDSLATSVVRGVEAFVKNKPEFENGHAVFLSEDTSKKNKSARN